MKWCYYYNGRWRASGEHPTSFRKTNGLACHQLKDNKDWGYSELCRFNGSITVPDLLLILKGYPL